jgi:hypothetical protein
MFAHSYNFIDSGDDGHPLLNEVDNLGSITWLSMSICGFIHDPLTNINSDGVSGYQDSHESSPIVRR